MEFLYGLIAFLYASVGHGGASGYLLLMALNDVPNAEARSSALIMNVLVATISFIAFFQKKHFNWRLFWPFALTSVPAAFLGSQIKLEDLIYKKILAVCLIISLLRILVKPIDKTKDLSNNAFLVIAFIIGCIIGILSGMLGIGGGILLSPIILLLGYGNLKQTAAVSSLFIVVNSLSGLVGVIKTGATIPENIYPILLLATFGGMLGAFFGASIFKNKTISILLSIGLFLGAIKLLIT